jgi:uncharacterized peroxidase-related enzyme
MPRINPIDTNTAPPKTKHTLESIGKKLGMIPNMMKTMANSPNVLDAYMGFAGPLASASIDNALQQQLAVFVSQQNQCDYCLSAHTVLAKAAGLTELQIAAVRQGHGTTSQATAALAFAKRLLDAKGHVTDRDMAALRSADFSDAQIVEIIACVALTVFTNYFNVATADEIDFPKVSSATAA